MISQSQITAKTLKMLGVEGGEDFFSKLTICCCCCCCCFRKQNSSLSAPFMIYDYPCHLNISQYFSHSFLWQGGETGNWKQRRRRGERMGKHNPGSSRNLFLFPTQLLYILLYFYTYLLLSLVLLARFIQSNCRI